MGKYLNYFMFEQKYYKEPITISKAKQGDLSLETSPHL